MLHPSYTDLMKVVNSEVEEGETPVVNSRYSIVLATAKRARQIIAGETPLVEANGKKPLSIAIQELENGKIKILSEEEAAAQEALEAKAAEEAAERAEAARAAEEEKAEEAAEEGASADGAEQNCREEQENLVCISESGSCRKTAPLVFRNYFSSGAPYRKCRALSYVSDQVFHPALQLSVFFQQESKSGRAYRYEGIFWRYQRLSGIPRED